MGEQNSKNVDMLLDRIRRNLELISELEGLSQEISQHGTEKASQIVKENITTFCWLTLQGVTYALRLITIYQDLERLNVLSSYLTKLQGYLTPST